MANIDKNYTNEFKKMNIMLYIMMILIVFLLIICCVNGCGKKNDKNDYDVSMMREVSVSDILNLFKNDDTYVLYIGRQTCDICNDLLPKLQTAQKDNNYITQYLDISKVDRDGDNWKELVELLNIETDQTLTSDGSGESTKNTFGYFLNEKGFTPCVIIISNKKMVAGFFGDKELTTLEDWLHNNGI